VTCSIKLCWKFCVCVCVLMASTKTSKTVLNGIIRNCTPVTKWCSGGNITDSIKLSGFPVLDHWAAEFIYFKFQNISKWKYANSWLSVLWLFNRTIVSNFAMKTVKPAYNGTAMNRNVFRCMGCPFYTYALISFKVCLAKYRTIRHTVNI